jgi:hypothetical protein
MTPLDHIRLVEKLSEALGGLYALPSNTPTFIITRLEMARSAIVNSFERQQNRRRPRRRKGGQ